MGQETLMTFLAGLPDPTDCKGATDYTALAKRMRAELVLAVDAGVFPKGTKFSVRKTDYNSFHVDITEWPSGAVFTDHYMEWRLEQERDPSAKNGHGYITREYIHPRQAERSSLIWHDNGDHGIWISVYDRRCVDAINRAVAAADRICDRHNYNHSRIEEDHHDVGYYLHVGAGPVIGAAEHGIVMEASPEMMDLLRRAQNAATALGSACVKSYCGRGGLSAAHESDLKRLIALADNANGRPVVYDKRRRRWLVDDRSSVQHATSNVCVACGREASGYPEQTGHSCGRKDRINGGNITERVDASPTNSAASERTRYFRCFSRHGKNLGDTPIVSRNGKVHPADGSYGLIDHVGNDAAVAIESSIVEAINAGKRGGRVATINWSLI